MFESILTPCLALIALTMIISFYHTYGSMKLMRPGNDWEKGIPSDPYPNAPKSLQMVKNNIKNLFEFPIIFYALSVLIFFQSISYEHHNQLVYSQLRQILHKRHQQIDSRDLQYELSIFHMEDTHH